MSTEHPEDRPTGDGVTRRLFLGAASAGTGAAALTVGGSTAAAAARAGGAGPLSVSRRTTEYTEQLLGTDVRRPRLSWASTAPGHGATQSAYQVLVATRPDLLSVASADVWDSGKVASSRSTGVEYGGPDLAPRTGYVWSARLWDAEGRASRWSEPTTFETGLLDEGFGTATWIGANPRSDEAPFAARGASWIWSPGATPWGAPDGTHWFRGRLALPEGTDVSSARLIVTADDVFTARVDGAPVLSPPGDWTTAHVADVTEAARDAVGRDLVVAVQATNRAPSGSINPGGLLAELVVLTSSGQEIVLVTGEGWLTVASEQPGWEQPAHDDSGWAAPSVLAPYGQGPWGTGVKLADDPAPLLRRAFRLDRPVSRARLYASGMAYHELHVNGSRVGDSVLDPGFTDYDETVLYVTHDVTDLVQQGENVLAAELGRGFFGMTTPNVWRWHQAPWHGEPRLIARLVVDHPDGSSTEVVSDDQWRVTSGPTLSNSLYVGETYDARLAQDGWTASAFDNSGWQTVSALDAPAGTLTAQENEPIRVVEDVAPAALTTPVEGVWIADFGRTTAGWATLRTTAPAGTTIRLLYGEKLRDDGLVEALGQVPGAFIDDLTTLQLDEYTARGDGEEVWEPKFSYKGFRYVQLEGLPSAPTRETVTMRVVHSDVPTVAEFRCSEPMLERLEQMMRRTVLNNLHSFPASTPMYEKNGWTGDVQVAAPSMAGTLDMARFHTKWLGDLRDSQVASGQLPVIVPSGGWGYQELAPAPEWTTVYPFLLCEMYRWYGDERLFDQHWDPVVKYLDWELGRLQDGLAVTALGDWVSPGYINGFPPEDTRLTATAYLYRALIGIADVGDLTGRADVATRLRTAAAGLRERFNATFLDSSGGVYRTDSDPEYRQTSNAIPLAFGLVPDDVVQAVADNLVADVEARDWHLNTGCLGTSVLLPVLTTHGHADAAMRIALQRSYPSWGYWVGKGADTMWEAWEVSTRSSRNHFFHGTVSQWLLEHVAGVRCVERGWKNFVVRPDARSQLSAASLGVDTVRGRVEASWRTTGTVFYLDVEVPVGSTAEVHVPAASGRDVTAAPASKVLELRETPDYVVHTVGAGRWEFVSRSAADQ